MSGELYQVSHFSFFFVVLWLVLNQKVKHFHCISTFVTAKKKVGLLIS